MSVPELTVNLNCIAATLDLMLLAGHVVCCTKRARRPQVCRVRRWAAPARKKGGRYVH